MLYWMYTYMENGKKESIMDMTDAALSALVDAAIKNGLCEKEDRAYMINGLLAVLHRSSYTEPHQPLTGKSVPALLELLCDDAAAHGLLQANTTVCRDLFSAALMGVLMPRPSQVIRQFFADCAVSPQLATDRFYRLCCDADYVMTERIRRDLHWQSNSPYGVLDISVNLSKPEKDPAMIAAARLLPQSGYPLCALCHENEGFAGDLTHAPRQTLRQIPLSLAGECWYLQYSPYAYYQEHCIVLSEHHTPMRIERATFARQLDFVRQFPHYFIGSNADLPIVGGSILSHDHMQGGRATFPMQKAPIEIPVHFSRFPSVTADIVRWPMSVLRLSSTCADTLISLADLILSVWRSYSDPDAAIFAQTTDGKHNTLTPVTRMAPDGKAFEMDLVLRNNITTPLHPMGLYHPHREKHFIKKENIGLIEVMGLAILPARLKKELSALRDALLREQPIDEHSPIAAFADMAQSLRRTGIDKSNVDERICAAVGEVFTGVLEDAGVYKCDKAGRAAFLRFVEAVNRAD